MWFPWFIFDLFVSLARLKTSGKNYCIVHDPSPSSKTYKIMTIEMGLTSEKIKGYEHMFFGGNYAVGSLAPRILSGTPVWFISQERRDAGLDALGCNGTVDNFKAPSDPWIAVVMRGDCSFTEKARNAKILNATGLLVLHRTDENFIMSVSGLLSIIEYSFGKKKSVGAAKKSNFYPLGTHRFGYTVIRTHNRQDIST